MKDSLYRSHAKHAYRTKAAAGGRGTGRPPGRPQQSLPQFTTNDAALIVGGAEALAAEALDAGDAPVNIVMQGALVTTGAPAESVTGSEVSTTSPKL
jgi:hypothetical protein